MGWSLAPPGGPAACHPPVGRSAVPQTVASDAVACSRSALVSRSAAGEIETAVQRDRFALRVLQRERPERTNTSAPAGSLATTFPEPARRSGGEGEVIYRGGVHRRIDGPALGRHARFARRLVGGLGDRPQLGRRTGGPRRRAGPLAKTTGGHQVRPIMGTRGGVAFSVRPGGTIAWRHDRDGPGSDGGASSDRR